MGPIGSRWPKIALTPIVLAGEPFPFLLEGGLSQILTLDPSDQGDRVPGNDLLPQLNEKPRLNQIKDLPTSAPILAALESPTAPTS